MKPDIRGLVLLLGVIMFSAILPGYARAPQSENYSNLILVQGSAVMAFPPPVIAPSDILGSFYAEGDINHQEAVLLAEIAKCESGFRNVCNSQSCKYGQGIFQLIESTRKECENGLGKPIDAFNEQDSWDCAYWLLTETEQSYYHWGFPDNHPDAYYNGIRWGSFNCWGDLVN